MIAAAILASATAAAWADDAGYILEDAKVAGTEIYAFPEDGQAVLVVLGDFALTVGDRLVSARDAVVWVREQKFGASVRHDITIYAEGDVRVVEPGGASAVDKTMLVTLRQQGKFSAAGVMSDRPLTDFPLYRRAVEVRDRSAQGEPPATEPATGPASREAPELRIELRAKPPASQEAAPPEVPELGAPRDRTAEGEPATSSGAHAAPELRIEAPPGVATSRTAESPGPTDLLSVGRTKPPAPVPTAPAGIPAAQAGPAPSPATVVTFRPGQRVAWREVGARHIGVATGGVYLSQGTVNSALFLELQSQAAVVFSERAAEKDVRSPMSPKVPGVESPLPGPQGLKERITGVYLEGDVVIRRGERYIRGPAAYYDFTTDRAIMPDAVFRTVQPQRDIPIYVRAEEFRALSAREMWFRKARVTTSDFYKPNYHVGASRVYLMDNTEYDEKGQQISEQKLSTKMLNATFNVAGVPLLYLPILQGDFTRGNTALRSAQIGQDGRFGFGVQTEWDLFRLFGLLQPEGYRGRFELDWYERGVMAGAKVKYARQLASRQYSGYWELYGVRDDKQQDDFGDQRENIASPQWRGRILARHKELLPRDWTVQFELSYLSDRNFLEQYFPSEYQAGKEQETLVYARKQKDDWAVSALAQYRLNRFDTQTESFPDLGFYLLGRPLWQNRLVLYSESHAGFKRFVPANYDHVDPSAPLLRLDTREEVNAPMHFGPLNLLPYATGRLTYWSDETDVTWLTNPGAQTVMPGSAVAGENFRPYGQVGVKSNMHFSRVYSDIQSRVWDLNRLRHVVTPEVVAFASTAGGAKPSQLFPMDGDIEQHLGDLYGVVLGAHQRLQTHRGAPGKQHVVDWMRLTVMAGFYGGDLSGNKSGQPADGRFDFYRPEYSIGRDHVNFDYEWNISDSTTFLADANYDIQQSSFRRANAGLAISRDPRLRYYVGLRWIDDLNSSVGTFGFTYQLTRKYSVSFLEQYDFLWHGGGNLATAVVVTRKFPRWYVAVGFVFDASLNDVMLTVSVWPEGIPELKLGGEHIGLLGQSSKN